MDESSIKVRMVQVLDSVASDIATVRTGRATSGMVESIICPAYGGTQRLKIQELASINVSDPQSIVIDPWDKSIIGDIRKGILEANVGLNPSIDGELIRISIPPMTTEDRIKFVKLLGSKLENGKIMIRQVRGDGMHEIKSAFEKKEISEDEKFTKEKGLQDLTDEFVGKIEEMGKRKEEELLQI